MKTGVSTGCFYPSTTDVCLEKVAECGAKYAEVFFNTDSELNEDYLLKLKKIADENGVQIISVHPYTSAIETFMFFARTDYKLDDSVRYYEKYFRACQVLGADCVVIHGCHTTAEYMTMERYASIMNILAAKAREYGVYVAQENVVKFKCGYVDNLREFMKHASDDIKYVLDVKQAVRAGQDLWQILDMMGGRISHLHISDHNESGDSLLPGDGDFDFAKLFARAEEYGVEHALIEVYENAFDEISQVKKSIEYLDSMM